MLPFRIAEETPPRMRGRRKAEGLKPYRLGNTPAYAGKTAFSMTAIAAFVKHPRVCGEDVRELPARSHTEETPPRMRGRRFPPHLHPLIMRNTPAYAGKTHRLRIRTGSFGKHPRVCGEDLKLERIGLARKETPPRMRGRRCSPIKRPSSSGNTPAYAGKTDREAEKQQP